MGLEIPEKKSLTPTQRFSARWGELEEQYPTNNQESAAIFNAMAMLSSGKDIDECIESLPADNMQLVELFKELASAYSSDEK